MQIINGTGACHPVEQLVAFEELGADVATKGEWSTMAP